MLHGGGVPVVGLHAGLGGTPAGVRVAAEASGSPYYDARSDCHPDQMTSLLTRRVHRQM
jgi:hypothetical protein